ncbi:cathepsin L [Salvia divinorum]|uniref:Cathepsin L n=1 Tax=Salvia divinorum TaxID=28513 RepID=A0ABD1GTV0_SALDI
MSEVLRHPNLRTDAFFASADWCLVLEHPAWILAVRDHRQVIHHTCYGYAVTAALYGDEVARTGFSAEGSVQEFIDYTHLFRPPEPKANCNAPKQGYAFSMEGAFSYVQKYGLSPKETYPWIGRTIAKYKMCDQQGEWTGAIDMLGYPVQKNQKIWIKKFKEFKTHEEVELALHSQPAACVVESTQSLKSCKSGVIIRADPTPCYIEKTYHAMTIVGYGHDGPDKYYICQNSYGLGWGYNGYCKILRDIVFDIFIPETTTSPSLLDLH